MLATLLLSALASVFEHFVIQRVTFWILGKEHPLKTLWPLVIIQASIINFAFFVFEQEPSVIIFLKSFGYFIYLYIFYWALLKNRQGLVTALILYTGINLIAQSLLLVITLPFMNLQSILTQDSALAQVLFMTSSGITLFMGILLKNRLHPLHKAMVTTYDRLKAFTVNHLILVALGLSFFFMSSFYFISSFFKNLHDLRYIWLSTLYLLVASLFIVSLFIFIKNYAEEKANSIRINTSQEVHYSYARLIENARRMESLYANALSAIVALDPHSTLFPPHVISTLKSFIHQEPIKLPLTIKGVPNVTLAAIINAKSARATDLGLQISSRFTSTNTTANYSQLEDTDFNIDTALLVTLVGGLLDFALNEHPAQRVQATTTALPLGPRTHESRLIRIDTHIDERSLHFTVHREGGVQEAPSAIIDLEYFASLVPSIQLQIETPKNVPTNQGPKPFNPLQNLLKVPSQGEPSTLSFKASLQIQL